MGALLSSLVWFLVVSHADQLADLASPARVDEAAAGMCSSVGPSHLPEIFVFPSGAVSSVRCQTGGTPDGPQYRWYESGQLKSQGQYRNGERDGRWTRFHENGQKMDDGVWKDGKPVGTWKAWDASGVVKLDKSFDVVEGPPAPHPIDLAAYAIGGYYIPSSESYGPSNSGRTASGAFFPGLGTLLSYGFGWHWALEGSLQYVAISFTESGTDQFSNSQVSRFSFSILRPGVRIRYLFSHDLSVGFGYCLEFQLGAAQIVSTTTSPGGFTSTFTSTSGDFGSMGFDPGVSWRPALSETWRLLLDLRLLLAGTRPQNLYLMAGVTRPL